jgi:hypothetical protein
MDSYAQIIKQIILQHAEYMPSEGQIETVPLFDDTHGNYLLLDFGWNRLGRVHAVPLHLRLYGGKVWVERNNTDDDVVASLLEAGIPQEDIVLGFYRPERRKLTEFALG